MNEEALVGLWVALAGFIFIFAIIGLVGYILMSIGLMKMAQNQEVENPWLAWVPIGNLWIIGKIIRTYEIGGKKFEQAELVMVLAVVASIVLGAIPVIGMFISLAASIAVFIGIFKLYRMYAPEKAVLYIVLSVIFNALAIGIIFFMLRDKMPVEVIESQDQ